MSEPPDHERRLTVCEESTKSAHHRIDAVESYQNDIHKIALAVNTLAESVKNLCLVQGDQGLRLKEIEGKASKRLEQIITQIIGLLLAAAAGYLLKN